VSGARHRVLRGAAALTGGLVVAAGMAQPATAATRLPLPADQDVAPGVYLVVLRDAPAAAWTGHAGLPATRPAPGHRFDRTSAATRGYRAHLRAGQDLVLHRVGDPAVLYRWTVALDGFAARLGTDQVTALRADPRVARVERAHTQRLDATPTATRTATPSAGVVHTRSGGPADAGRRTVVGVVDTGLWPGGAVFSGLPQVRPGTSPALKGFHGGCATAPTWAARDCNDKVVSARWFVRGFGASRIARSDYLSARDGSGHGTAVASLAAGNTGVPARVDGQSFGAFSGTAPAARLAVYKACWSAPDPADDGCSTADVVTAVDQAVADGVDVLTSSVADDGGSRDATQLAYLGASEAGVVVTAAAGNGAGAAHNAAPWVTTVGASSRPAYQGTARLGDGTLLTGSMVSDRRVTDAPLVPGGSAAAPGSTARQAQLCVPGALDAGEVQGAVVVCERGQLARVDKSAAVRMAGGAGMLLLNTGAGGTAADIHDVPTVHLDATEGRRVRAYLRAAGGHASVTLDPTALPRQRVTRVAGFSGGGPVAEVVKPDVTAPGVAVLGAVAPSSDDGRTFDLLTGTSASAPQVAGLAAYLRSVHPTWSASQVRSALVTTAQRVGPATRAGAGEVTARRVLDPGLVLDAAPGPWRHWLAGDLRAADLNLPSLAVPELVRATTVVRRLTNVSGRTETYGVRLARPDGVDVTVRPSVFRLASGRSRDVRITVTARPTARLDTWQSGALTFVSPRHTVRLPLAVRARQVAAPRRVAAAAGTGSVRVGLRVATSRRLALHSTGLVPARTRTLALAPGSFDVAHPAAGPSTASVPLRVPSGSPLLRVRADASPGDDVDLYLYRGSHLVAAATSGSGTSGLSVVRPPSGDYALLVHANHAADDVAARTTLSTWALPGRSGAGPVPLTLRRAATPAGRSTYTAAWGHHHVLRGHWLAVVGYAPGFGGRLTVLEVS